MTDPLISKRLEELFDQALDLEGQARAVFVAKVDATLRPALLELLAAAEEPNVVDEDPASLAGKLLFEKSAIRAGEPLGAYTLLRMLGEGGMASVWLAERNDGQFEQQVAIKCLKTGLGTPEIRARFIQEQKILAKLQHPHIARMYDAGLSSDGVPFIVMEWVKEGLSLTRYCNQNRLSLSRRLALFNKICQAVSYAHQNLIVHRDLKPGNILVGEDGEPKLLDFGIAKLLQQDEAVTRTGLRLLTPEYAAPEQYQSGVITTATDVYALGVILYELLCGLRPQAFDKNRQDTTTLNPSEALRRLSKTTKQPKTQDPKELADQRATSIEHLQRSLKGDLDIIVMQALQQEPSRRYPSVAALADDLKRYLAKQPITARKDTWSYRTRKFLRRNAYAVAIASITFCLLLFATLFSIQQANHAQQQTELAKLEASRAKIEAQRATAVKRFLTDLLEVSDAGIPRDQLPSTETLLQDGAKRIQQEFNDTPELKLDLLLLLGRVHTNLGMYQQAEPLLKQALTIADKHLSPASETWLAAQTAWGDFSLKKDKLNSEQLLAAIAKHRRKNTRGNPALADALLLLGGVFNGLQDVKKGIAYIEEAIAMLESLHEADQEKLMHARRMLISALTNNRDMAKAENLARKDVLLSKKLFGEQHAKYAKHLIALANVLTNTGKVQEAESLARRTIDILERVYDKPNAAHTYAFYQLAYALMWQRKHREVYEVTKKAVGYESTMIATNQSVILCELLMFHANASINLGLTDEAEKTVLRAAQLARRSFGSQSPILAESLRVLSGILRIQKRYDEALLNLREALSILRQGPRNGITAAKTAMVFHDIAALKVVTGKPKEAIGICEEGILAIRQYKESFGYYLMAVQILKAKAHNGIGEPDQALGVLNEVFSNKDLPGLDLEISALMEKGKAQKELNNAPEAIKTWEKALSLPQGGVDQDTKETQAQLQALIAAAKRESP